MTDEGSHSFLATGGSDLDMLAFEEESRNKVGLGSNKVGSKWTPECCHGVHVASPFEHKKNHFLCSKCTKEPSGV